MSPRPWEKAAPSCVSTQDTPAASGTPHGASNGSDTVTCRSNHHLNNNLGLGSSYAGLGMGYSNSHGSTYGGMYGGAYGSVPRYGAGLGPVYPGGPFGAMHWGMDPSKDPMPPGLKQLESLLYSVGRITQMLEMNFDILQHFIGSLVSLIERVRALYADACQLTSKVHRQSLEFGESSLTTVRDAHSRVRRYPFASIAIVLTALSLLFRLKRVIASRMGRPQRFTHKHPTLGDTFASLALDGAWQIKYP